MGGWNGSGVVTLTHDWTEDRDAGIKMQASRMDTQFEDIRSSVENCLTKDGQNEATANIDMGGYKLLDVGNGTLRTDAANVAQVQNSSFVWGGTAGGTVDVITIAPNPVITAYASGQTFRFISSGANTGATTINVNSVGAKAVTKNGANALVAGDIQSGQIVEVTYDGTRFQITNQVQTGLLTENAQTGTTYTLVLSDQQDKILTCSNASAITLTIPPNSSVAFDVGRSIPLMQKGAGQVTVSPGAGVTINSPNSFTKTRVQYSTVIATKLATDTWYLAGDLSS